MELLGTAGAVGEVTGRGSPMEITGKMGLLDTQKNCWRTAKVEQGAFLLDGQAYFRAFRSVLRQASERVYLLAWDLNPEIRLERDGVTDDFPLQLGPFLEAVLAARPNLHIHVLVWDFSMIYAIERNWQLFSDSLGISNPRFHLVWDDQLPVGASHHQKVLVVDDALAIMGGLDLSSWRWDTPEHRSHDSRRVDPDGNEYGPYHDVQVAVTGEAARALGDLCAGRWKRATGEELERVVVPRDHTPWPQNVPVELQGIRIGLARTFAPFAAHEAIREIEHLHLDIIRSARRFLYLENQYFSSRTIADALAERLRDPEGPEVTMVLTQDTGGWLEEGTMGLLRDRLCEILAEADRYGRCRVYYPRAGEGNGDSDGDDVQVYVHAKLLIADDRVLKIGSSNLSNRSMRIDSEIDLVIEDEAAAPVIRNLRHRLLAGYFDVAQEVLAGRLAGHDRLNRGLDAMVSEVGASLVPCRFGCSSDVQRKLADTQLLDPSEPIDPAYWISSTVPRGERTRVMRRITILTALVLVGALIALGVKWGWGHWLDREAVTKSLQEIESGPWASAILMGLFILAGLTGFPINVILVAAAVVLGPITALLTGFLGSHLSALIAFGIGRIFGKPLVAKLASRRLQKLDRILSERGVFSVMLVRLVPVAPFVIVNLVAGASGIRFRIFNLGTLVGMAPGMLVVVLLANQLRLAFLAPGWGTILGFAALLLGIFGVVYYVRRVLASRSAYSG